MTKTLKLGDLATVRTILAFRDRAPVSDLNGNARAVFSRDLLSQATVDINNLQKIQVNDEDLKEHLETGVILMPGRGDTYPARYFVSNGEFVFPVGQMNVISTNNSIIPQYLSWYLNDAPTQFAISNLLTGTTVKSLNKSKLLQLPVTVPKVEAQLRISDLQKKHQERTKLKHEIMLLDDVEVSHICRNISKGKKIT